MSDFSLTLVLRLKSSKIINNMAKVIIKSEKITPFGGIFHVRELYSPCVGPVIDKVQGLRCRHRRPHRGDRELRRQRQRALPDVKPLTASHSLTENTFPFVA